MKEITAAGTVALQPHEGKEPKVLLVHRPAYDDWTLPKGKLKTDEFVPSAAARETFEETGVRVRLDRPLDPLSYPVGGGSKTVHYWKARVLSLSRRKPDHEVDKVAWLSPRHALRRMTYPDEQSVLQQALELEDTTPLLVIRHGKAMLRRNWIGRDQLRPLNTRGRRQSQALVRLLEAYDVRDLASSSSARCMQTLAPYARLTGLEVTGWTTLSEEQAEIGAKAVRQLMGRLAKETASAHQGTAICGHRPVLPLMLEAIGVANRPMQTGAVAVTHLKASGRTAAVEWYKPRN